MHRLNYVGSLLSRENSISRVGFTAYFKRVQLAQRLDSLMKIMKTSVSKVGKSCTSGIKVKRDTATVTCRPVLSDSVL